MDKHKQHNKSEDNNNKQKKKEDDIMALAEKSPAIIIDKDKTQEFFSTLNKNIPTQQFWSDCKKLKESISSKDIDEMNNLIKQRIEDDK